MMIKILMHGCNGRMGQMISGLVRDEEEMMIAAGVDTYQGVSNEYPVFGSIDACDDDVDVVIDFSNAAAADAVMEYCAKRQIPLVFCTTGLSEEQLQKLEDTAKQTAVLKSANMSLGINLLLKLLKDAAKVLAPAGYDIEIVENITTRNWMRRAERRWRLQIRLMKRWTEVMCILMTVLRYAARERRKKSVSLQFAAVRSLASMKYCLPGWMR